MALIIDQNSAIVPRPVVAKLLNNNRHYVDIYFKITGIIFLISNFGL